MKSEKFRDIYRLLNLLRIQLDSIVNIHDFLFAPPRLSVCHSFYWVTGSLRHFRRNPPLFSIHTATPTSIRQWKSLNLIWGRYYRHLSYNGEHYPVGNLNDIAILTFVHCNWARLKNPDSHSRHRISTIVAHIGHFGIRIDLVCSSSCLLQDMNIFFEYLINTQTIVSLSRLSSSTFFEISPNRREISNFSWIRFSDLQKRLHELFSDFPLILT